MEILIAFAVGWAIGTKSGGDTYEDLVAAIKAVRDSDEFRELIVAARSHAGHVLVEIGQRVAPGSHETMSMEDVLARVRGAVRSVRAGPEGAATPGS